MQITSTAHISRSKAMFKATNAESIEKRPYFLLRLSSSCQPDSESQDLPFLSSLCPFLSNANNVKLFCYKIFAWSPAVSLWYSQIWAHSGACLSTVEPAGGSNWDLPSFSLTWGRFWNREREACFLHRKIFLNIQAKRLWRSFFGMHFSFGGGRQCIAVAGVRVSSFQILSCHHSRPCRCSWPVLIAKIETCFCYILFDHPSQWPEMARSYKSTALELSWDLCCQDPTWTFASPNPVEVVAAGPQATRLRSNDQNTSRILGIAGIMSAKQLTQHCKCKVDNPPWYIN